MLLDLFVDVTNYDAYLSAIHSLSNPFDVEDVEMDERCVLTNLWGQVRYTTQPVPAYLSARVGSSWGELRFKVLNYRREKQCDILKLEYLGCSE